MDDRLNRRPPDEGHTTQPDAAPRWKRAAGYVIDALLLLQLNGRIVLPLLGTTTATRLGTLAAGAVVLAYEVVGYVVAGRTPGKWVVGTAVVDAAEHQRISLVRACTRWALPAGVPLAVLLIWPDFVPLALWAWRGVVYGAVAIDGARRGLHDRVAGTVVITMGRGTRPPRR